MLDVEIVTRTTVGLEESDEISLARVGLAVEELLRRTGIHAALGFLNARTRYRFSGVYRVEPPILRNLHLFDRENPTLNVSGDINPLRETYCGNVSDSGCSFTTADAMTDQRLVAHPARGTVLSYLGVPILLATGVVGGTLCHFDVRPRLGPAGEGRVLERVAPLIAAWVARLEKD